MRPIQVRAAIVLVAALVCGSALVAETRWRQLGGTGVAAGLAGPAGSPVADAWFSADGRRLYAALRTGTVWVSENHGISWGPAEPDPGDPRASLDLEPSGQAALARNPYRATQVYALDEHLYRSDDGGGEWVNLTATANGSVIGERQAVLAISPAEPELIVVGNSMGLWKSYDAGVSWSSLNSALPNFPEARFRSGPGSAAPLLETELFGTVALVRTPSGPAWRARPGKGAALAFARPAAAGQAITAEAGSGPYWSGTADGLVWISDDGAQWHLSRTHAEAAVVDLWADGTIPSTALAIVGRRILRTTNGGRTWFDITSDLPASQWSAVAGHAAANTVYVGGPLGIYSARVDLENPGPAGQWSPVSGNLPDSAILDLAVDSLAGRLYASLEGRGVHWTRFPPVERALQALSAADLSARPAAPGALLTILGTEALQARAAGRRAPILDASRGRTQLQVPFAVEGRSLRLRLQSAEAEHVLDMPLRDVAPAIFEVGGEALILDAGTGALVGWVQPARPGGHILVTATGLGAVEPPWPEGMPPPEQDPPRPVARISASLDGEDARVVAAHLAAGYIGMYVVEIAVPNQARHGTALLRIEADGELSNAVKLVIGR